MTPDYESTQVARLDPAVTMPELYRRMTAQPPRWIALAFRLRDVLARPFGIRPIEGFGATGPLAVGGAAHFFTVETLEDTRLQVAAEDHHLRVVAALERAGEAVRLTTRVWNRNWVGRLYMLPVGLAHPAICRALLRRGGAR